MSNNPAWFDEGIAAADEWHRRNGPVSNVCGDKVCRITVPSNRRRSDMCNCQNCRPLTANGEAVLIGDEVLTGRKAAPFMTELTQNLSPQQTELTLNVDDGDGEATFEGEPLDY